MVDVKKLITGFLIVGSAAAGSGLILATIQMPSAAQTPAGPQLADAGTSTQPLVPDNAFVQPASDQNGFQTIGYSASPLVNATSDDPNNLTDVLANSFMSGVVAANPSGPQDDANGNPVIANPDAQSIAAAVANTAAVNNLKIPNWDIEAESQVIKTTGDSSSANVSQYSNALNDVINQHFVNTGIVGMVNNQNADPSQSSYVQSQVTAALGDTLALSVPAPLTNLQKSWVKVLVYEKNILALLNNVNVDPVKTSLILSDEQGKYNTAIQDLGTQMQNAATVQGFSLGTPPRAPSSRFVALLDSILGIKTARAQWVVFNPTEFADYLLSWANDIILQILKNVLIALIQRKVLTWIQGSGAPRFLTQWATTFVTAFEQTALNAINSQMACVYSAFAPQMRLNLTVFYKQASNNVCANTFQAALGANSFQQFYNNFANGGWIAYGASMMPSGNYYGDFAFQTQIVNQNAQNQKQATIQKSTAGQGLKGDQVCDDGSNPNGTHTECLDNNDTPFHPNPDGSCPNGMFPSAQSNGGMCANGHEPIVTTPATFTGLGAGSGLDSSPKLITAANNIVGLLDALLTSLLSSLANTAINAATSAVNSGLNGGVASVPPATIQGGGSTSTIPVIALGCNPPTQTISTSTPAALGATGGTTSASGTALTYTWSASNGTTSAGPMFSALFPVAGTYTITLTDSAGDPPATCNVIVQ